MCDNTEDLGCLPNGCHLFRRPNEAGGFTYLSDEIGGGVTIWDTCLVDEAILLTAIICEHHRKYRQRMIDNGWKPTPDVKVERMAATGGSFLDPERDGD